MSSHRLRPSTLAVLLALVLGACQSWSRHPVASPRPDRPIHIRGPVRVTHTGGPPVVLVRVRISRDSLSGNEHAKPYGRVAIPVSDVRKMETREVNPLSIVGVVVLSVVTLIALGAFVPHSDCSCVPPP